ncbi:hypothetical protein [Limnofasciculus baicalensis]|uniref:Uncharacterized protein n=1 Tax=Limnofasciculus baicalensis BBK-W-15 TaxID=2699891 RepID=A0AAE3GTJ0_9CYAN|nr:hypothetical protein [Limnofasciculus baicalensis]MCP2729747.1 hypothetical protein [Limnofasciculus baicalensis BBK-W-15]
MQKIPPQFRLLRSLLYLQQDGFMVETVGITKAITNMADTCQQKRLNLLKFKP